ncbi:MAG: phosphate signaling complex protein PhoU [Chloroflexota bacterium]
MRPREHFTQQLEAIHRELRALGELAAAANARALDALMRQDLAMAQEIVAADDRIDQAHDKLESQAVAMIATQQPVAGDLRRLMATISIASELERIADYAKSIAKLALQYDDQPWVPVPDELAQLATEACAMLDSALSAFIQQDVAAARQLGEADQRVDELRQRVLAGLIDLLRQQPESAARVVALLFVTQNLERMADRATNIAEQVIYIASGDVVELNP